MPASPPAVWPISKSLSPELYAFLLGSPGNLGFFCRFSRSGSIRSPYYVYIRWREPGGEECRGSTDFSEMAYREWRGGQSRLQELLNGYSIEVTPRTAAKVAAFGGLLPRGTRVYVAHIAGTPFADMIATARRLRDDGFPVMPHIPARMIKDVPTLNDWIRQYRDEAGVDQALLVAGGMTEPRGDLHSSIQLLETGLFDRYGFRRLHVAGHPEGNRDIDAHGSTTRVDEALTWKQSYSGRTDADMAIVTQFFFDAKPVIRWVERLQTLGVTLPIHVGIAGPAKLQTLIKYAIACGIGPSLKILQKRAMDVTKLLLPYEPIEVLSELAAYRATHPHSAIEQVHFFPLGGIMASAAWANAHGSPLEKTGAA